MNALELKDFIRNSEAVKASYPHWEEVWAEVGAKVVNEEMVDESRWSIYYDVTVQLADQFFTVTVGRGATEYQENNEVEDDLDSLVEVRPVEVVVTKYVAVDKVSAV
jgi:hypothetical protein